MAVGKQKQKQADGALQKTNSKLNVAHESAQFQR